MRSVKVEDDNHDGKVDGQTKDRWTKLREGVDEPTFGKIEELNIRGLTASRVYRRVYPSGSLAANLIGYLNKEGTPVTGAERHFDLYLKGRTVGSNPKRTAPAASSRSSARAKSPVQDGNDVVLTIDSVVQHILEDELRTIAAKFDPHFATIIASDPRTGRILGMANYPSYDLNNYSKAPLDAQRNYAVTDIIEPGSTFKIVAAGAALDQGLVTPSSVFDCGITSINFKGRDLNLPKEDHPFGRLSVAEIVSHSSNRGAAQLAMLMGEQNFYDYAKRYGFGATTTSQLGGECCAASSRCRRIGTASPSRACRWATRWRRRPADPHGDERGGQQRHAAAPADHPGNP